MMQWTCGTAYSETLASSYTLPALLSIQPSGLVGFRKFRFPLTPYNLRDLLFNAHPYDAMNPGDRVLGLLGSVSEGGKHNFHLDYYHSPCGLPKLRTTTHREVRQV